MSKYRIVYKDKWPAPYHVERRIFWFFWVFEDMFNSRKSAELYVELWLQKGRIV